MTSGVYTSVTAGRGVAEGNIVYTKIPVCPVRLQVGSKPFPNVLCGVFE